MSMCKVCLKDSKDHSQKLWLQHQKNESCQFCQKGSKEHSEKLCVMSVALKLRLNFVADCIRHRLATLHYVPTAFNLANLGTKELNRLDLQREQAMMNVLPSRATSTRTAVAGKQEEESKTNTEDGGSARRAWRRRCSATRR